ncbi:MAG: hypothetical protein IJS60_06555 [Abditibacteriota bacterium]|nr:hypothetical protein [Abditibacteriota bacterium]
MRKLFLFIILIIVAVALVKVYSISDVFKPMDLSNEVIKAEYLVSEKTNQDNGIDTLDLEVFEKEINPYNNCIFYDFSEYESNKVFTIRCKENDEWKNKEIGYSNTNQIDLDFYNLKIQNITATGQLPSGGSYIKKGSFIVDNNKKIFYVDKIYDYKVYKNELMILYNEFEPGGYAVAFLKVLYIYRLPDNKFFGIDYETPKFISTHTGYGYIKDAKIIGQNYVWCKDLDGKAEIYRVSNSKFDYDKNLKIADKEKNPDIVAKNMKLMWCYDSNKKSDISVTSKNGIKAHDYIYDANETDALKLIDKL